MNRKRTALVTVFPLAALLALLAIWTVRRPAKIDMPESAPPTTEGVETVTEELTVHRQQNPTSQSSPEDIGVLRKQLQGILARIDELILSEGLTEWSIDSYLKLSPKADGILEFLTKHAAALHRELSHAQVRHASPDHPMLVLLNRILREEPSTRAPPTLHLRFLQAINRLDPTTAYSRVISTEEDLDTRLIAWAALAHEIRKGKDPDNDRRLIRDVLNNISHMPPPLTAHILEVCSLEKLTSEMEAEILEFAVRSIHDRRSYSTHGELSAWVGLIDRLARLIKGKADRYGHFMETMDQFVRDRVIEQITNQESDPATRSAIAEGVQLRDALLLPQTPDSILPLLPETLDAHGVKLALAYVLPIPVRNLPLSEVQRYRARVERTIQSISRRASSQEAKSTFNEYIVYFEERLRRHEEGRTPRD